MSNELGKLNDDDLKKEVSILGAYGKSVVIICNGDIRRLREFFMLSQKDLSEDIGVSKAMISQLENGKKTLSDNMKEKLNVYFTELKSEREQLLKHRKEQNDRAKEEYDRVATEIQDREQLIKNTEMIRKPQMFNPSVNASLDMIWLTTMLNGHKKELFEETFLYSADPYITVDHTPHLDIKGCQYIINIQCEDVKITMQYGFKEKGMGAMIFPKLVLRFNPNKANFKTNTYLGFIFYLLGENPTVTKFDVCKDYVGLEMGSLYISNEERKHNYQYINNSEGCTHYIGDKNHNGVMIYDKEKELKYKDGKDLGYKVIRYEHRRSKFGGMELQSIAQNLPPISLPTVSAYNSLALSVGYDDETKLETFDFMTFATASMILEGRIDRRELKASNRRQYQKVMDYLEMMELCNLSLSHIEVIRALELFVDRYEMAYHKGFETYKSIFTEDKPNNSVYTGNRELKDAPTTKEVTPITDAMVKEQLQKDRAEYVGKKVKGRVIDVIDKDTNANLGMTVIEGESNSLYGMFNPNIKNIHREL